MPLNLSLLSKKFQVKIYSCLICIKKKLLLSPKKGQSHKILKLSAKRLKIDLNKMLPNSTKKLRKSKPREVNKYKASSSPLDFTILRLAIQGLILISTKNSEQELIDCTFVYGKPKSRSGFRTKISTFPSAISSVSTTKS